jgi:hypothetical protein
MDFAGIILTSSAEVRSEMASGSAAVATVLCINTLYQY